MCQSASSFFSMSSLNISNLVMESIKKGGGHLKKHNIDVGEINK